MLQEKIMKYRLHAFFSISSAISIWSRVVSGLLEAKWLQKQDEITHCLKCQHSAG
jgi:hypothetical protein